tara:strand:+ start:1349 stop:2593 length:1245 start_codon:yes stop_codon:yes gene_type:complete
MTRKTLISLLITLLVSGCGQGNSGTDNTVVRVGLLHSRSGTMALSENTVAEAERLAIEDINASGGLKLNGQRVLIQPVEEDGMSDPDTFASQAEELLDQQQVVAIFGGWTSASRKAMLPVLEARDALLFYPVQYEGQECSAHVVYGGSVPNQQSEPALNWMLANRSKRVLLIGSDYIYPRTANRIMRAQVEREGGTVIDERYLPLGSDKVNPLVESIRQASASGPVVVINTLNGDSNLAFFEQLYRNGLTGPPAVDHGLSLLSLSISEEEALAIGTKKISGTYASWSYFQSLDGESSKSFAQRFRKRYGYHRVINDPGEAAYSLVHLWAEAAEKAGSTEPKIVRQHLIGTSYAAPGGLVTITPSQHLNQRSLLGQADDTGNFQVVKDFGVIAPKPWNPDLPESKGRQCDQNGNS